jgi:hypothetical protein
MPPDAISNLKEFNREVEDFVKTLPQKHIVPFQKKLVLEALKRVVLKTPVDTGRARGNWQVTIGSPAEGQLEGTGSSDAVIARGLAVLANLQPYQIVWISNNVDYIEFLEHGSSKQAPEGMLALTIEELRVMFS